jgi:SpoVK/Ycf46/Vps4 family AAA+-type ATPase
MASNNKTPVKNSRSVKYESCIEELKVLISCSTPLVWVTTHEEKRLIRSLAEEICNPSKRELWIWTSYRGLQRYEDLIKGEAPTGELQKTPQLAQALQYIEQYKVNEKKSRSAVFVMLDANGLLTQNIPRMIRDIIGLTELRKKSIFIVSGIMAHGPQLAKVGLEPTLEKQFHVVDFELPRREQVEATIRRLLGTIVIDGKMRYEYDDVEIQAFSRALQGLTEQEVEDAIFTSITHLDRVDVEKLLLEKKNVLRRSDILEYVDVKPSFNDVGGLDEAKRYFSFYADQFSPEAKEFGLEPLRGVLLIGCPGTGKSLLAKAVSSLWKLPLIRLDVGRVMGGIVGQSESRMREAVNTASACSPCVLWIDEIEKALSGTKSSNQSDSGTLSRVFGTLLTAMEEGMKEVVVLATANDISQVPPELIRRFNEVFFVDLPEECEREDILNIHLRKRGRDPKALKLDMKAVTKCCHLYTGSEMEKAVQEAIARAWRDGKRAVKTEDLVGAVKDTKPISKVMAEQINNLRSWARDRARYASSLAAAAQAPCAQKVVSANGQTTRVSDVLDEIEEIQTEKEYKQSQEGKSRLTDIVESLDDAKGN